MKTQCQNLNRNPTQTTGVVRLTPSFVDHLVMFIKHGLYQKSHISGHLLRRIPSGILSFYHKLSQHSPFTALHAPSERRALTLVINLSTSSTVMGLSEDITKAAAALKQVGKLQASKQLQC